MVLTMVAERRNSPFSGRPSTSSRIGLQQVALGDGAAMVRVTSVVGHRRSSIRVLTEFSISPQAPSMRPKRTRWRVLPSRPTTWPTRSSCCAMRSIGGDDVVEGVGDAAGETFLVGGHAYGEIAIADRKQCLEKAYHVFSAEPVAGHLSRIAIA